MILEFTESEEEDKSISDEIVTNHDRNQHSQINNGSVNKHEATFSIHYQNSNRQEVYHKRMQMLLSQKNEDTVKELQKQDDIKSDHYQKNQLKSRNDQQLSKQSQIESIQTQKSSKNQSLKLSQRQKEETEGISILSSKQENSSDMLSKVENSNGINYFKSKQNKENEEFSTSHLQKDQNVIYNNVNNQLNQKIQEQEEGDELEELENLRMPIKQFMKQNMNSDVNKQKEKKNKYSIIKRQNNPIPKHQKGHSLELAQTKVAIQKAKKQGKVLVNQNISLNIYNIFRRILSLIQIKRLFTKNYKLSMQQYEYIADCTYFPETKIQETNLFKNIKFIAYHINKPLKIIMRLFARIWPQFIESSVLRPDSKLNLTWMILQLIIYSIFLSMVSVTIFFGDEVFSSKQLEVDKSTRFFNVVTVFLMSILDFIKQLNCGFLECGEVIIDRKKIFKKYISSAMFYFDLLGSFSLMSDGIFSENGNPYLVQILKMFVFFKLYTLYDVAVKIQDHFLMSIYWNNLISLLKLTFSLIFVCHIFAILYYQQALLQIRYFNEENTWISISNLLDEPTSLGRYIQSLYNATCLLVAAIQYNPKAQIEAVFVTLAVLANTAFFGFIVTAMGQIVDDFRRISKEQRKELATVNQYMEQTQFPKELQIRIKSYLEYYHKQQFVVDNSEFQTILTKLPSKIKNEVEIEVNQTYINQIPLIQNLFSSNLRKKIIPKIQERKFIPGEIIYNVIFRSLNSLKNKNLQESCNDDKSIYLVLEGKVDIYIKNKSKRDNKNGDGQIFNELTKGMCFGEYSFFSGKEREASVKAASYCTLTKIKREDFILALGYFHEDFEKFKHIQDELVYQKNLQAIQLSCSVCQSKNHLFRDCNLIHMAPFTNTIIKMSNKSEDNVRIQDVQRLSLAKFKPLCNLNKLIANSIIITENYQSQIEASIIYRKQSSFQIRQIVPTFTEIGLRDLPIKEQDNSSIKVKKQKNKTILFQEKEKKKVGFLEKPKRDRKFSRKMSQFNISSSEIESEQKKQQQQDVEKNISFKQNLQFYNNQEQKDENNEVNEESKSDIEQEFQEEDNEQNKNELEGEMKLNQKILNEIKMQKEIRKSFFDLRLKEIENQNLGKNIFLEFESLKPFNFYYPEHNYQNVIQLLISKKVVHSNIISKLVCKINQISQQKHKNQIKVRLLQQQLKEKEARSKQSNKFTLSNRNNQQSISPKIITSHIPKS